MAYAVIRLRSPRKKKKEMNETLSMLRLNKVNHCVIIPERDSYEGMLRKVEDLITWGEIDIDTLVDLLEARSEMDSEELEERIERYTSYDRVDEFAIAVTSDKINLGDIEGLESFFRLNPPKGGYEGTKKPYNTGGSLGYRGNEINDLIQRMLASDQT